MRIRNLFIHAQQSKAWGINYARIVSDLSLLPSSVKNDTRKRFSGVKNLGCKSHFASIFNHLDRKIFFFPFRQHILSATITLGNFFSGLLSLDERLHAWCGTSHVAERKARGQGWVASIRQQFCHQQTFPFFIREKPLLVNAKRLRTFVMEKHTAVKAWSRLLFWNASKPWLISELYE